MKHKDKKTITLKLSNIEAATLLGAVENISPEHYFSLCNSCCKKLGNIGRKLAKTLEKEFDFNIKDVELPFEEIEEVNIDSS